MSEQVDRGGVIERLRANLRAAGIRVEDRDLEGMVEKGFLGTMLACEEIVQRAAVDLVPDYLKPWGDNGQLPSPVPAEPGRPIPLRADNGGYPALLEAAGRIRRREVSPVELTEAALARIAERDPALNAFQVVLPEYALATARKAEEEIAAGRYRGPLHGVPLAVKDLLAMAGTRTTAGSKILADWVTDFDAAAVERLKTAGAVIVGKTKMSEFAYSPASTNAHYGLTHNPWNLEHDTGGSSSGSGAAVADGLVFGALGSDTGGSIRMPAALCGIVGIKPTFGRTSLYGAVTLAWSLDHVGPMTRSVADAAVMLGVLAGFDPRDPRTREVPVPDYLAGLEAGVKGVRVGVLRDDGSRAPLATPEVLTAWQAGLAALERNGARLVEIDLPDLSDLRVLNSGIVAIEAAAYHEPMLRERLGDFGEFMRHRILSAYGFGPSSFVRMQQARQVIRQRCNAIFEQVDLLSTPTMPYGAPLLGDPGQNTSFTGPFNSLGWPAVTVPVGLGEGRLPLALQIAGRPWDDASVLRAALVVEVDGPWRGGRP